MDTITIRPAAPDELTAVAELRWQWILENEGEPVTERDEFVRHFVAWARENGSSHRCTVLLRGETVIGMAWLAVLQRVPSPRAPLRASGDLQCVYVVPAERDGGLGGRLIDAVLTRARELGLERVTVHSSPRAIPAYARHGFAPLPSAVEHARRPRPGTQIPVTPPRCPVVHRSGRRSHRTDRRLRRRHLTPAADGGDQPLRVVPAPHVTAVMSRAVPGASHDRGYATEPSGAGRGTGGRRGRRAVAGTVGAVRAGARPHLLRP
ncbi:GNAT family N-acetyltransferase [Streptomyces sp. NPDC086549]|uniref:GNAT family N-acetyltransferase n=1 Tax=Streptomyces sp. NPDC086549 TaxID=3365752 RepID=UPI00380794FA